MTGGGWILALVVAVAVAAAVFALPRLEGEAPEIESVEALQLGVGGAVVPVTITDSGTGLRTLEATLVRGGDAEEVRLQATTFRGSLMWGGTPSGRRQELELEIDPEKLSLEDGEATLVVTARDWSWRSGLDGNQGRLEVPVTIDTQPPRVQLESGLTYIYRGGSGAVAYRVSEPGAESGVRVGDAVFQGFPLGGDGSPDGGDPRRRIALFAVPVTAEDDPEAFVFAADASGNESRARIPIHLLSRSFEQSDVSLPSSFLENVVPELARDHGIDASDPVAAFQTINDDMRASNEEKIRTLLADSSPRPLWEGAFEQLRNSKVTSRFAESRRYKIDGRAVSRARHYGFDLASSAAAPVTAANSGVVKYAGELGIYGNCVLLDHGLGLGSLYGHLSVIEVEEGQRVEKGERLGATGATGLAGGDHLHFAILVGGTYVDPLEWWDPKWVQSHVAVRMGDGELLSRSAAPVAVPVDARVSGSLVRRYKRFLADVETPDGRTLTVHCPNPGSMLGLDRPGSAVRCSSSDDPRRKLRHTLEMIRVGRTWVGLHTLRANQLAARALRAGAVRGLSGYRVVQPEVRVAGGSRLDFRLDRHRRGRPPAYVEVKSVTLAEGTRARFPDSVTARGRRHMETLASLCAAGQRAALLFVVQRGDCSRVEPADEIDPDYGAALRRAVEAGVEVFAVGARVLAGSIRLTGRLPVVL